MKKVAIGGVYYGLHNIGDEAILYSMINSFKSFSVLSVMTYGSEWIDDVFPDVNRRPICADYDKPKFGLYVAPKKKIFTNMKKIRSETDFYGKQDAYICGGATILSDCPWYSLKTVELAGKAGKPVYLWGVGMAGPIDKDSSDYVKGVLNRRFVKKVFTRDEHVKERLIKLGVDSSKLHVSYDPAIMITGEAGNYKKYLSPKQQYMYDDGRKNIVMAISGEADIISKTPIDAIEEAVTRLVERYSANLFLIPTGCGKQCMDTALMKRMEEDIAGKYVTVIEKEFAPEDLVCFLKGVDLIISSRLHMNIFGACAGIPSIGLVRNEKIIDFADILGLPYMELNTFNAEKLTMMSENIFLNADDFRNNVVIKRERMRNVYGASVDILASEIMNM